MYIRILTVILSIALGYMIRIIIEKRNIAGDVLIDRKCSDGPRVLLQQDIPFSNLVNRKFVMFKVNSNADLSKKDFSLVNSTDSKN